MRNRFLASLMAVASLMLSVSVASAGAPVETADVIGQGLSGPVVAADGATIMRTSKGVVANVTMDTPQPGSYLNPAGPTGSGVSGHPEAFSLWVFVFFNPEECASAICGPADLISDPDVVAGAFNAGGHLEGGPNLNLQGYVNQSSFTFGGANAETIGTALAMGYTLADAEIHLAVAPHGALDPALLPGSISTPNGGPAQWWLALFGPAS
jgi:hypothetical protein